MLKKMLDNFMIRYIQSADITFGCNTKMNTRVA